MGAECAIHTLVTLALFFANAEPNLVNSQFLNPYGTALYRPVTCVSVYFQVFSPRNETAVRRGQLGLLRTVAVGRSLPFFDNVIVSNGLTSHQWVTRTVDEVLVLCTKLTVESRLRTWSPGPIAAYRASAISIFPTK